MTQYWVIFYRTKENGVTTLCLYAEEKPTTEMLGGRGVERGEILQQRGGGTKGGAANHRGSLASLEYELFQPQELSLVVFLYLINLMGQIGRSM